mmetsp:Transcript_11853/g.28332  ORF Transcript_11853/g.28332 Transcript_11853/m.28332 type:complete len:248 (-) Transcript_11853:175-918(-)
MLWMEIATAIAAPSEGSAIAPTKVARPSGKLCTAIASPVSSPVALSFLTSASRALRALDDATLPSSSSLSLVPPTMPSKRSTPESILRTGRGASESWTSRGTGDSHVTFPVSTCWKKCFPVDLDSTTRQPSGSSSSSSGHGPPPSRDPSAGSSSIWIEFLPSGAVSVVEAAQDGFPSLSSPNWLGKQRASVFLDVKTFRPAVKHTPAKNNPVVAPYPRGHTSPAVLSGHHSSLNAVSALTKISTMDT